MEKPDWEIYYEQLVYHGLVPREGYLKIRLKRGGPWVPARIYRAMPLDPETGELLERSWLLTGEIDGKPADYRRLEVWGRDIEKEEFEWLTALNALKSM